MYIYICIYITLIVHQINFTLGFDENAVSSFISLEMTLKI